MKLDVTENNYYTEKGRIAKVEYRQGDVWVGRVTALKGGREIFDVTWSDEGKCLNNSEYNLLHTVNYVQMAEMLNVTYRMIRGAINGGELGFVSIFPKNKEKVFEEEKFLEKVKKIGKIEFRRLIVTEYRKAVKLKNIKHKVKKLERVEKSLTI